MEKGEENISLWLMFLNTVDPLISQNSETDVYAWLKSIGLDV